MKILYSLVLLTSISFSYSGEFTKSNTENIKFSSSTIPYLVDHPNKAAMNTYNAELKSIMSKLRCRAPKKIQDKTFWEIFTGIGFVNEKLISIKIRSNYNCDNLRTVNNEDSSLTFDFDTRRVVKLGDLFYKKESTMKTIRTYLYENITEKSCRDKLNFFIEGENLFKDHLSYYLGKSNLVLQMKLPYGLRSCIAEEISIPFSVIKKSTSYTSTLKTIDKLK